MVGGRGGRTLVALPAELPDERLVGVEQVSERVEIGGHERAGVSGVNVKALNWGSQDSLRSAERIQYRGEGVVAGANDHPVARGAVEYRPQGRTVFVDPRGPRRWRGSKVSTVL